MPLFRVLDHLDDSLVVLLSIMLWSQGLVVVLVVVKRQVGLMDSLALLGDGMGGLYCLSCVASM